MLSPPFFPKLSFCKKWRLVPQTGGVIVTREFTGFGTGVLRSLGAALPGRYERFG